MKSFIILKYLVDSEPTQPINLTEYRNFIENHPECVWMEFVHERYAKVQRERKEGIRQDKSEPREKLDFFFRYNNASKKYEFSATYDIRRYYIFITFDFSPKEGSMEFILSLATYLNAHVYDEGIIISEKDPKNYKETYSENLTGILQLDKKNKQLQMLFESYTPNNGNVKKGWFFNSIKDNQIKLVPWDYSLNSVNNLKNLTVSELREGFPVAGSKLDQILGKEYFKVFEHYVGEVIIKKNPSFKWGYIKENDEITSVLINENSDLTIIPGTIILKLVGMEGDFDISKEIQSQMGII